MIRNTWLLIYVCSVCWRAWCQRSKFWLSMRSPVHATGTTQKSRWTIKNTDVVVRWTTINFHAPVDLIYSVPNTGNQKLATNSQKLLLDCPWDNHLFFLNSNTAWCNGLNSCSGAWGRGSNLGWWKSSWNFHLAIMYEIVWLTIIVHVGQKHTIPLPMVHLGLSEWTMKEFCPSEEMLICRSCVKPSMYIYHTVS